MSPSEKFWTHQFVIFSVIHFHPHNKTIIKTFRQTKKVSTQIKNVKLSIQKSFNWKTESTKK